ncbi:MAG: glutathione synthase [Arenicellales bacterium]|nr:glutathione synthase [Arenicellales bacterium]
MNHAFIMDPLARVKAHKDTTYYLMLAAAQRSHGVCYVDPGSLALNHDQVMAWVQPLAVHDDVAKPFVPAAARWQKLADMDVVWIRTDPPFDRAYLYVTLLLEHLPPRVRVINRPATIRDWNEKLAALRYPTFTPRTLVARDPAHIRTFMAGFARVTIKPVDGHGGKGIVFATAADRNLDTLLDDATRGGRHWVIAQEYIAAATEGDKRILLLNGEPLGAILRLHAEGAELNNLDQGGSAQACQLTARDREICTAVASDLVAHGVVLAGIDVIGGMLMEINITSPTGLQEMSRFDGRDYHHQIIASLE